MPGSRERSLWDAIGQRSALFALIGGAHAEATAHTPISRDVAPSRDAAFPLAPLDLVMRTGSGCPDEQQLRARIRDYLGSAIIETGHTVRADLALERDPDGFRMELHIDASTGSETTDLTGPSCATLADVAAIKMAMALDAGAVVERLESPSEPDSLGPEDLDPDDPGPEPAPDHAAPQQLDPRASATRWRPRLGLSAAGGVAFGALPGLAGMITVTAALLLSRAQVEAGVIAWLPRTQSLPEGGGGTFRMVGGHVDACLAPGWPSLRVPVCAGVELASMHGRGRDVASPQSARRMWGAVRASPRLLWLPHPKVGLFVQPVLAIAFLRPGFAFEEGQVVHRAGRVEVRGLMGLEVRLP